MALVIIRMEKGGGLFALLLHIPSQGTFILAAGADMEAIDKVSG